MEYNISNLSGARQLDCPIGVGYAADMREITTQLYGSSDPAEVHACFERMGEDREFVIVSYAHDDNVCALKCFDTDVTFRMIFANNGYESSIIYYFYLKLTWYKVLTDDELVFEMEILDELSDRQWLGGLIVTIGERLFILWFWLRK